jgi:hypothetical protein
MRNSYILLFWYIIPMVAEERDDQSIYLYQDAVELAMVTWSNFDDCHVTKDIIERQQLFFEGIGRLAALNSYIESSAVQISKISSDNDFWQHICNKIIESIDLVDNIQSNFINSAKQEVVKIKQACMNYTLGSFSL